MSIPLWDKTEEAAAALRAVFADIPRVAIVLGSGLGAFADRLQDPVSIDYGRVPHFPTPTVAGHRGRLVVGRCGDTPIAVLQGRFHFYEGHDLATVTLPIRVLRRLGVETVILTAATGGIAANLSPGSLVCVSDHLNLIARNPLRGPNDDRLGERFPDMSEVYSRWLRGIAHEAAGRLGVPLHSGVYAAMPGPSYETPAEVRMLRTLGADVVGMSTVPEAIVARHEGMNVLALAVVSNLAAGVSAQPISHEEVIAAGRAVAPTLAALLEAIVTRAELSR
jgi:purine-nucleoside phosphorylase